MLDGKDKNEILPFIVMAPPVEMAVTFYVCSSRPVWTPPPLCLNSNYVSLRNVLTYRVRNSNANSIFIRSPPPTP